jgi:hypothetical protein
MIRKKDNLLINRGINPLNFGLNDIINDNVNFINSMNLIAQNSILPINSPFEAHPYSHLMNYNNEYELFIMGTFPPISYLYDTCPNIINLRKVVQGRKIPKSQFPFFHGNKNLMWDYFLTPIEKNNLDILNRNFKPQFLTNKLAQSKINYGDLIEFCQRENDYNANDINLYNIIINERLIKGLFNNKQAKYILFNTSSIYNKNGISIDNITGFIDIENSISAFDLFIFNLQKYNFEIEVRINIGLVIFPWTPINNLPLDHRCHKLAFELKIKNINSIEFENLLKIDEERIFNICTPLSPAVAHRYPNNLSTNPIIANWLINNPGMLPKDFLYNVYQNFRNSNWNALYSLNC